jgi:hypothetical protein
MDYSPGLAGRKEGAIYTAYGADPDTTLSKPNAGRSWLIPVIVVASVCALVLMGIGGFLLFNPMSIGSGVSQGSTQPPSTGSEEEAIRQVVRISNELQIRAWRELDTELLRETYTGEILAENIAIIKELKSKNMYAVPENLRLDILEVRVQGNRATVRTVEEWKVTYYKQGSNKVVEAKQPEVLTETYHMVKHNGRWLIDRIEFQQGEPPPD